MDKEIFIEELADILEMDKDDLNEGFELNDDSWDSIAVLATIATIDEQFGVTVPAKSLTECASVGALWELVHSSVAEVSLQT